MGLKTAMLYMFLITVCRLITTTVEIVHGSLARCEANMSLQNSFSAFTDHPQCYSKNQWWVKCTLIISLKYLAPPTQTPLQTKHTPSWQQPQCVTCCRIITWMRNLSKSDRQRKEVTMDADLRFWLVCYMKKKKIQTIWGSKESIYWMWWNTKKMRYTAQEQSVERKPGHHMNWNKCPHILRALLLYIFCQTSKL